ncbi:MAG: hypothetical protein QHH17_06180 [Candidatus Bathyarchaeota archaeon]|jgi:hypothetical protein|nr:hypothetical protein [Candidatus Bathyarchaeota archaeon]
MFPNPTPTTLILLTMGVSILILIMLLPSIIELKKPKDAGPRIILDYANDMQTLWKEAIPTLDVEEEHMLDKMLVKKIVEVISVLPNLEA